MIRILEGLPDNVVAAEAVGKVTADDYESVLMPALEKATSGGERARMLFVLGPEFEWYEAEAALDDLKIGLHGWSDFERIAFVSDDGGYRALVKGFGLLMPGQVETFSIDRIDAARAWVSGFGA